MANDANPRTFDRVTGPEPRRRLVQSALHQLIQNLESLRTELHRRINELEARAREGAASDGKAGEREQALERRVKELEEIQRRMNGQAATWEGEKDRLLIQIDEERARLAAAWERLEQERIHLSAAKEAPASAAGNGAANGSHRRESPPTPAAPTYPAASPPSPANDLAKAQVIRIFKTVMDDVRRNS